MAKRKLPTSRAAAVKAFAARENRLDELQIRIRKSTSLQDKIDAVEEMYRVLGKAGDPVIVERLKRARAALQAFSREAKPPKLLH